MNVFVGIFLFVAFMFCVSCYFKALRLKVVKKGGKLWIVTQHACSSLYFTFLIKLLIVTNLVSQIATVWYTKKI